MKGLNEILRKKEMLHFPVIGVNGYAGEQDGSRVLFTVYELKNKKEAEKILIPEKAHIHWARYSHRDGWTVSVGVWNCDLLGIEEKTVCKNWL
jgi:hypothetical protein